MLRRPPGEGRLVAEGKAKVLLALAVFLLPWIQLVDAQQQHSLRNQPPSVAQILPGNTHQQLGRLGNKEDEGVNQREAGQQDGSNHQAPWRQRHEESPFEGDRPVAKLEATISQASTARKSTSADFDGRYPVTTVAKDSASKTGSKVGGKTGTSNAHSKRSQKSSSSDSRNRDLDLNNNPHALATVALDEKSVRAPKLPRQLSSIFPGARLPSPQSARSLDRWEVEDYVLLATVDGHLRAVNPETGTERWHLETVEPAVETIHYRPNISQGLDAKTPHVLDGCVWAIEPSLDGPLYLWKPSGFGAGLSNTGLTMKELVDDIGPSAIHQPPIVYTGDKKTTLVSVDAATGNVIKWFGQGARQQPATCFQPKEFVDSDDEKCTNEGIITLKRTEYTVTIQSQDDSRPLATLKYTEWGPNSADSDLHQQYRKGHHQGVQDHKYITSRHDGKLYSLDNKSTAPSFGLQLPVPTYRVFHVARPEDAPHGSNPELVVLPQPEPPVIVSESARASIFLNQTESGGWYALSGRSYPLVVNAPRARVGKRDWGDRVDKSADFTDAFVNEALVGTHILEWNNQEETREIGGSPQWQAPGLPERSVSDPTDYENGSRGLVPPNSESMVEKVKTLPDYAAGTFLDFLTNPFLALLALAIGIWYMRTGGFARLLSRQHLVTEAIPAPNDDLLKPPSDPVQPALTIQPSPDYVGPAITDTVGAEVVVTQVENSPDGVDSGDGPDDVQTPETDQTSGQSAAQKQAKRKRGKRGGVKHKPKDKQAALQAQADQPRDDTPSPLGSELNQTPSKADIDKIMNIPQAHEPGLRPDIKTIGNPEDVSQTSLDLNKVGLLVNTEEQLGIGSQGTVVFSGTFFGREVAVKRMLSQFTELATQETKLLLESDSHPNVIQYYAMHESNPFLYIALERCDASLADIIDKPHLHTKLATAGERDIPNVLLQIANGLSHLHDLRIVHRDLKPQNILVAMKSDGKPRLVVSDFGLCKKLDGAQSSFGATTAHAAGTSGWRAPELLLDDDARDANGGSASMASSHSESSVLVSADLMPNRRATRAIDVFSLGLVFFYVLTKGCHPFDCGDRYMREVNIRKGQLNLKPLEVLGDFAFEAQELIRMMLSSEPRRRPSTKEVMSHPFFWGPKKRLEFLCNISDHFEKESRDPPSEALLTLESYAPRICRGDFLKVLPKDFVESLGKQRKYTGSRLLDLLRAFRNKWYHRNEMSDSLKKTVGTSYEDYLGYWTRRFPNLLVTCFEVVYVLELQDDVRFEEYFEPMRPW